MLKPTMMKILSEFQYLKVSLVIILFIILLRSHSYALVPAAESSLSDSTIRVEYSDPMTGSGAITDIPLSSQTVSAGIRISIYRNPSYQVVVHEIDRGNYTEVNGDRKSVV